MRCPLRLHTDSSMQPRRESVSLLFHVRTWERKGNDNAAHEILWTVPMLQTLQRCASGLGREASYDACSEKPLTACHILMDEHSIFGYPLPMPRSDLYIALATVAGFLPAVVIMHHTVLFIVRQLRRLRPAVHKQD